ncbi:MAG TPA: SDR family oxidoreductase, partial [Armatimonadota bacterium]|nr:SDR family oxidoreductase [Armatimonadota bacterium]
AEHFPSSLTVYRYPVPGRPWSDSEAGRRMTKGTVLVAGATGRLGIEVVQELKARGERVRALGRSPRRLEALRGLADELCVADALNGGALGPAFMDVDRVFSCLGASVIPMPRYGRETFTQVDTPANRNLVDWAVRSGVRKFVYVSVFGADRLPQSDFIRGHELVVEALRASGLDYSVLRPTGFFSAMDEILLVASRGLLPEFNGGTARTNPIHEADLAARCVEAFDAPRGWEADVGGPDALTRREIAAYAWQAIGREARAVRVPVSVLRTAGRLMLPLYPRVGHLMTFIADILVDDFVAPAAGTRHIQDYFMQKAAELRGAESSLSSRSA